MWHRDVCQNHFIKLATNSVLFKQQKCDVSDFFKAALRHVVVVWKRDACHFFSLN